MKLQLTIDHGKDYEILALLEKLGHEVDIVEIGYPVLVTYGLTLVEEIHKRQPDVPLCVDAKVFHGGTGVTQRCFDAGASYVSVLSAAPDPVITKMVNKAKGYGGKIICDMSAPVNRVARRTAEVDELGVDYVMIPTCYLPDFDYDLETHRGLWPFAPKIRPLDLARTVKRNLRHAKLGVNTGINEANIREVVALEPELVLVGRGILDAADRVEAARRLKRYMPFEG
jgi:3-hexulose-6-phosphate synthase